MRTSPLMTADELIGYEIPGKRVELVRGRPLAHEPPGFEHGDVTLRIGLPPGPIRGYAKFAPDLAVEVRSPSDRTGEILAKVADWLDGGTALVWIVDPLRRTAQVYRPDGTVPLLGETDALNGEDLLPGFTLSLATLFD